MEENKKDVLPLEGEPLTTLQISEPVVNALASALNKIETDVPTQYINDGPPDIDAEHLNHAEQAIMRVTNLANGAADAISALQSQVTQLNSDLSIGRIPNKILYFGANNNTDCNLLKNHFVLAKGKNFPPGEGFWYVQTIGYEIKPDGTVKTGKQIAWQYTGIKLFARDCYNDVWDSWTEYITKSDIPNLHYTIQSSVINNPTEAIKEQWASMPDGYYLCEMRCGAAYIAIIQRIDSGQHGSVIIHGYGTELPVYLRRVNGEWI